MKRLFLSLILAAICSISSFAYDFSSVCSTGQTLYYNITSSTSPYTVEVTYQNYDYPYSSTYPTGSLTIPSSVTYSGRTYSVASIGNSAFSSCSGLTTVSIPNSVTSIGDYAFSDCMGLTTVSIPNSVTSIGDWAFTNCSGLTTVNFNATNCTSMGNSSYPVFSGCTSLSTLNIGSNVTNIPDYAFYGCSGLTSVTIGNSVRGIGENAFQNCSGLTAINYTGNIAQWCEISFANVYGNPLYYAHNLYVNNELVTGLVIPQNVTAIKNYTFYGATCLTSASIGNSVVSIGWSAFCYCSGLTTVTISNSVDSIASFAFSECSGLTSITIPESVTIIDDYAFYGCSGLTTVNFNATNCTSMGSYVWNGCSSFSTLNIGSNVTNIPGDAFRNCSGLTGELTIPNSVTSIGSYAFYGCSVLTSVTIPSSITSIGAAAFEYCSGLTAINYTGNIAQWCGISFGDGFGNPLYYAHNLYVNNELVTGLVIPQNVTAIKNHTFWGATCLTSASIGNSVVSIGKSAFCYCSGLTSVTIPNSVDSIANYAFFDCSGLTSVTIPNSVTSIGNSAFYGCSGIESVTIGNSVASIGNSAFYGCNGLDTFNFNSANCTGTTDNWFDTNNTLSKITIGENVTTIPNNAFANCVSLDSIISYASNPPVIYASTFDSNLSLNTPVVVPCGTVDAYEDADFWYNFRHIQQNANCGTSYTITVLSSNNAYGTVSGGGTYMANEVARLTATPNEGYSFSNWSDGSTENPHDVVVTADATYIATFVQGGSSNPTVYNSIEATACGSYTWNDRTYTESGEYQQTFTAANSADSIVTLTLTIHPAPQPQITLYGELDACNPSSVAFATDQYQSYLWSNGATTMITSTSVPGYYYVEVTDENGCSGRSEQVNIGASNALTEAPQISVVGMNSENHNVVAWSALDNVNVNGYNIYREDNVADVYELMASIDASADTYWTDETADPSARAYRYKVTAVDQCGGESPMSDYHKTMHLTINRGIGNAWNLIWSHYEGFTFGTYRIYRGTTPSNMTMIGEVPSNLNSYTDNTNTSNEGFYYQVEVVRNTRSRDAEISSRSNIVDNGIITEYTITVISANPNRGTVTGGGTYPEGTVISIEAIANEGFEFASWSDENTENPRQITVTGDATYVASFNEVSSVPEYTITVISANPNRGTVTGGGTYPEGTVISIEAIANDGYEFASWSDDNTDNPRQITVMADATFIASFIPATGIEENSLLEISLFPNPATDILNITSSETISEIEIVNVMGQVVRRIEVNSDNAVCDVNELTSGVYVVRIRTLRQAQGAALRKFVKE